MIDACKYGIKKSGLTVEREVKINESTSIIYATLGSSMQSWGQHVKISIVETKGQGKQITQAYYTSKARISMNVTEAIRPIQDNIHTYAENYLDAAKEGIDMTRFNK